MCYNSKCEIEIVSNMNGSESTVSAKGRLIKTSSRIRVDYSLDGDACTLTVNDGEVVQTRRGEQNIKMIFRKGEQTECVLESGGFRGAFTVFTNELQLTDGHGITLIIGYTLGEDNIKLTFSAKI